MRDAIVRLGRSTVRGGTRSSGPGGRPSRGGTRSSAAREVDRLEDGRDCEAREVVPCLVGTWFLEPALSTPALPRPIHGDDAEPWPRARACSLGAGR